ncbi:gamma-glutamylcyclotransferase family protein [Ileibacterium valens]|uniref:gamma-glutamylcyclotransferase family protein n=1 Tax=Ileibacterium valens TaxID=1862668 RepID=UPI002355A1AA|nr:gamma-glutamylcyclotransferase family protein [Ileibacterium valens]
MKRYYAAYGSNLNLEQMKWRCPDAKVIGTAVIEGYELLFKGSKTGSYLTIEPDVKNQVPVGIFEVSKADENSLDRYEGFPTFYYKKEMTIPVRLTNGKTKKMKIFVYIMDESRDLGLPSLHYVETCLQGYKDFGFDKKYLDHAIRRSSKYDENRSKKKNLSALPKGIYRISRSFQKR